jgi:hypothetical protein
MLRSDYGGVHPLLPSDLPFQVTRWVLMVLPPTVYALALGLTASRYIRRTATRQDQQLLSLACVGIGLLGGNYYFPDVVHLAFAAPPAFAVLAGLATLSGARSGRKVLTHGCALLLLVFVAFAGVSSLERERSRCSAELSTPRGAIAVEPALLRESEAVLSFLEEHLPEGEPLFVYPGGPGINFLMGRPNPSPYLMGLPHIPGSFAEEDLAKLVAALDRKQVRYVVVVLPLGGSTLTQSERPLERYIRGHYRVVKRFGTTLIMERDDQQDRFRPEGSPPRRNELGASPPSP